ncbi:hypothetical protein G9C85_17410 [Halorubellus sp. JP-L1]|uniref:hypothetical protein n=1 Tax=Halorubellus sp. JP-L1 TaxID=2715753 RepID=UPI00140BDDC5|nr:hypothetical protein [Halorubellus sp. JP-L1]NHN43398.1 hypothetical protein [Halorubellus sp. JP-L1]
MSLDVFPEANSLAENCLSLLLVGAGLALLTSAIADFLGTRSFVLPGFVEGFLAPVIFLLWGSLKITQK